MKLQVFGQLLAVVSIALLAGIYLGDYVGVRHARNVIDPGGFVQMQQAIHIRFVRLMPSLILSAVIGNLIWIWNLRGDLRSLPFWLVLGSLLGIVAIAVMTRIVSVPLNQQLMSWAATAPPDAIHRLWQPWEQVNRTRLLIAVVVLVTELALLARPAA